MDADEYEFVGWRLAPPPVAELFAVLYSVSRILALHVFFHCQHILLDGKMMIW